MITAKDGYNKIKKSHILDELTDCLDFGSFYVYFFKPLDMKDDEANLSGTFFDAIDKKSGRHFMYDLTSDYDAFENAKKIKIDDVYIRKLNEIDVWIILVTTVRAVLIENLIFLEGGN